MKRQVTPAKRKTPPKTKRRNSRPRGETIAHTADIGLRCRGRTLAELFRHAAAGMFRLIATPRRGAAGFPREIIEQRVVVQAANREELLVAWLGELLSLSDARGRLVRSCRITRIGQTSLDAVARLVPKKKAQFEFHSDIKAVTYHKVRIRSRQGLLSAEVFFDV